ncbi:hypothetical protein HaLaN_14954, partial [Haematococcus lacustris]
MALHPLVPGQLLLGCTRGGLALLDLSLGSTLACWQVPGLGAQPVSAACVSPSGVAWALGDASGLVRPPMVALEEGSGFAATPQYPRNLEL